MLSGPSALGTATAMCTTADTYILLARCVELPVPNSPYGLCVRKATFKKNKKRSFNRAQELCESRGGRPGLPVPNSPYSLYGCKATLNSRTVVCRLDLLFLIIVMLNAKRPHRQQCE